ncbi:MAG: AAA family ATPase [Alphaproteobacteria bacterium]|nr:AAA family ATPase [Alphaproteobacteria bacterium]
MSAKKLDAAAAGMPVHNVSRVSTGSEVDVFSLSSHARAREAMEFGLIASDPGFNIFVVGEDRSGRMSTTLSYLREAVGGEKKPSDWVYLNNFRLSNEPIAAQLPAGAGRSLLDAVTALIPQLRDAFGQAFAREEYQQRVQEESDKMRGEVNAAIEAVRKEAQGQGLSIVQSPQGLMVVSLGEDEQPRDIGQLPDAERLAIEAAAKQISERLTEINRGAARQQAQFAERMRDFNRQVAEGASDGLLDEFFAKFGDYPSLSRWAVEFRVDVLENYTAFLGGQGDGGEGGPGQPPPAQRPEDRYAVNLFVDNSAAGHPPVVLESNPTYTNLFGRIEYRQIGGMLQTDFALIRPGALHQANGGILVLRAEALAANGDSWIHLKGALRDRQIRVEEMHRAGGIPIAGAPKPQPIPLDVKVVIVGAPNWYYTFFSIDPEFQAYFKVKAEIDPDLEATAQSVSCYATLIQGFAARHDGANCQDDALEYLLGYASRLAFDRTKLSAKFELIEDIINEAAYLTEGGMGNPISRAAVVAARTNRRNRNARIEDRIHEGIRRGTVMIDTEGAVVGQVNGLTVRDMGDHAFGAPARVTARTSIGRRGVTNIERETLLGGPIQQKGAMVIQGFLAGLFAQRVPMSFNASITFEQSYGGVEGDSASLAEALAILSDLSGVPLRQDLAVTGSVNQHGEVQAIGGLTHKAEGFYRTCVETGELTGSQGVVFPASNEPSLVLDDEVNADVAAGRFHVWSVKTVAEGLELFTGESAGVADANGDYPPDTIFGRIAARLVEYDRILETRSDASEGAV